MSELPPPAARQVRALLRTTVPSSCCSCSVVLHAYGIACSDATQCTIRPGGQTIAQQSYSASAHCAVRRQPEARLAALLRRVHSGTVHRLKVPLHTRIPGETLCASCIASRSRTWPEAYRCRTDAVRTAMRRFEIHNIHHLDLCHARIDIRRASAGRIRITRAPRAIRALPHAPLPVSLAPARQAVRSASPPHAKPR